MPLRGLFGGTPRVEAGEPRAVVCGGARCVASCYAARFEMRRDEATAGRKSAARALRRRTAFAAALGVTLTAAAAGAVYPVFGPHDVPTTFFISKSDDHNRVDYGIRLDAHCAPLNDDAMVLYWHEFEPPPPPRTHGLNFLDQRAYGIAAQRAVKREANGGDYVLRLRQVGRSIGIASHRGADGRCTTIARTTINGNTAELSSIYVKLSGPFSVDYIDIRGRSFTDGKPTVERLKR